jgi:hypothetical protein
VIYIKCCYKYVGLIIGLGFVEDIIIDLLSSYDLNMHKVNRVCLCFYVMEISFSFWVMLEISYSNSLIYNFLFLYFFMHSTIGHKGIGSV